MSPCSCDAIAPVSCLEFGLFRTVRGVNRWPLLSPFPATENGRSYLRGRLDDLDDNQFELLVGRLSRGPGRDPHSVRSRLKSTGFYRIYVPSDVQVVRCALHRGIPA